MQSNNIRTKRVLRMFSLMVMLFVASLSFAQADEETVSDACMTDECQRYVMSTTVEEILPSSFSDVEPVEYKSQELDYEDSPFLDVLSVIMKIFVVLILGVALYFVIKYLPSIKALFRGQPKTKDIVPVAVTDEVKFDSERIFGHDYSAEVKAAIERGDFKYAIRIAYLTTLAHLHERKVIVCRDSKSPTEYYYEVTAHNNSADESFRQLTSSFLAASYGPSEPQRADFDRADSLRTQILNFTKTLAVLVLSFTLSSCDKTTKWDVFRVYPFYHAVSLLSHDDERSLSAIYADSCNIFDHDIDLLVHHFMGSPDSVDTEFCFTDTSIANRLLRNNRTLINVECLAVRSGSDVISLVEGNGYCVDSLVADVNADGVPRMSALRYLPSDSVYQFPSVLASCYLNADALELLTSRVRKLCPGVRVGRKVLLTVDGRPAIWRLQSSNGGQFVVSSLPILFSEYGMTFNDGKWNPLIFRIVRDAYIRSDIGYFYSFGNGYFERNTSGIFKTPPYTYHHRNVKESDPVSDDDDEHSPWTVAFWAMLIALPFLMRRRQRIITVMPLPVNKTTELVRHAAAVYEAQGDYRAIFLKRYAVFSSVLAETIHLDIASPNALQILISATGLSRFEISNSLSLLIPAVKTRDNISAETMNELVNRMERIENRLTRNSSRK